MDRTFVSIFIMTHYEAAIGVFITLEEPSGPMNTEAVSAGYYHSPGWNQNYPRIQILTIDQLLHGAEVKMPPQFGTFKQAQKVGKKAYALATSSLSPCVRPCPGAVAMRIGMYAWY